MAFTLQKRVTIDAWESWGFGTSNGARSAYVGMEAAMNVPFKQIVTLAMVLPLLCSVAVTASADSGSRYHTSWASRGEPSYGAEEFRQAANEALVGLKKTNADPITFAGLLKPMDPALHRSNSWRLWSQIADFRKELVQLEASVNDEKARARIQLFRSAFEVDGSPILTEALDKLQDDPRALAFAGRQMIAWAKVNEEKAIYESWSLVHRQRARGFWKQGIVLIQAAAVHPKTANHPTLQRWVEAEMTAIASERNDVAIRMMVAYKANKAPSKQQDPNSDMRPIESAQSSAETPQSDGKVPYTRPVTQRRPGSGVATKVAIRPRPVHP